MKFLIYALACWRLTYMLIHEDGPAAIFARLRTYAGVRYDLNDRVYGVGFWGDVLSCFWCCSIWVAAGLLLAPRWVSTILAGSALAIGLRKVLE